MNKCNLFGITRDIITMSSWLTNLFCVIFKNQFRFQNILLFANETYEYSKKLMVNYSFKHEFGRINVHKTSRLLENSKESNYLFAANID